MMHANLIPARRIQARRNVRRARGWLVACGAYAGVVTLTCLVARLAASPDESVTLRHQQSAATIERTKLAISAATARLQSARSAVRANVAIGTQPDFSAVLGVLARATGPEVVLSRCAVNVDMLHQRGGDADSSWGLSIELSGFGRTTADVSQFALRLEQLTLFRDLRLIDTRREPFLAGEATSFRLSCRMGAEENTP